MEAEADAAAAAEDPREEAGADDEEEWEDALEAGWEEADDEEPFAEL